MRELQIYIKHNNVDFVCATIRALGRVADADPEIAGRCMEGLMHLMLCNKTPSVIEQSVVVLRQLIQQNSGLEVASRVLFQLSKLLVVESGIEQPLARSS